MGPAVAYIGLSIIAVSLIIGLILVLWTLPLDHDTPPRIEHAIAQEWFDQYPRECFDKDGILPVCNRGQCGGRIKPPRTHHCSVCQRCRMGWDHHVSIPCEILVQTAKHILYILSVMGEYILKLDPITSHSAGSGGQLLDDSPIQGVFDPFDYHCLQYIHHGYASYQPRS